MRTSLVLSMALVFGAPAAARGAPETASPAPTAGGLRGYQARLESETVRILGTDVSGEMKAKLGRRGTSLWACVSIREWQRQVLAEAPTLARSLEVIARRSEVLWGEAGVSDRWTDPIPQMASVHAMQRGLVRVLVQLGVRSTPPPATLAAPPAARSSGGASPATGSGAAPLAPRPTNVAMNLAPIRPARAPQPSPPPAPTVAVLSPVELAAYSATLDRETLRILTPEVVGPVLQGLTARRASLRAATTVAGWRAALVAAHPALEKAAAVLERRTEVLREQLRVRDAYASEATQRAAVRGLEAGLDRLLKQFGR